MKRTITIILFCLSACILIAHDLQPVVERENYQRTSTYQEVIDFVFQASLLSPQIRIVDFARSAEKRLIPLLVLSAEGIASCSELRRFGKPAVLIMANIHAGEVEGKEALQFFLRDFLNGRFPTLLKDKVVLLLPVFNADGNDKFGKNRRDNGPELAGVRHNGQNLDLNRDYIKLESAEVSALVKLLNDWDPLLVIDLHTTNGSYHRHTVTYSTGTNPNISPDIQNFMWQKFFGEMKNLMFKDGFVAIPYGNFLKRDQPQAGWYNEAGEFRYGSNYIALRNRLTILDENYAYASFKERVTGCYALIRAALETFSRKLPEIRNLLQQSELYMLQNFAASHFWLDFKPEKVFSFKLQSWEFEKVILSEEEKKRYPPWIGDFIMKKSEREKDYLLDYFVCSGKGKERPVPEGYLLEPVAVEAIRNLQAHGIILEEILEGGEIEAGNFILNSFEQEKQLYQGHFLLKLQGEFRRQKTSVKPGMIYVSVRQPLGRLLVQLLEPEAVDSLASWGFFNRFLFQQWSNQFNYYPVYQVYEKPFLKSKVINN